MTSDLMVGVGQLKRTRSFVCSIRVDEQLDAGVPLGPTDRHAGHITDSLLPYLQCKRVTEL